MESVGVEIPLTRGKVALVSLEDADDVLAYKWCATPAGSGLWYAVRGIHIGKKWTTQSMHKFLLKCSGPVDHKDGNGLNNQRHNIREVTSGINNHRRRACKSNSGFYGVSRHLNGGFCAYLKSDKKTRYLGIFETAEEAARCYDKKAKEKYGAFARLNFEQICD